MTEFTPSISTRETEELIEIKYSPEGNWNEEAISQAESELIKRKVSQEEQNQILNKWDKQFKKILKDEQLRLKSNIDESYKMYQIILLFLLGPLDFFNPYYSKSMRISELNRENFKLKVKQRIIIISLSCIAWYAYIKHDIEIMNQKKIEKIESIDISDWESKMGYD
tara:strand:+ start:196 stop:696 length:501 start_codon:yes stop_codon:yes gene_type:complete